MEDELKIDFGKYIETLVPQWKFILACALVFGFCAVAFSIAINSVSPSYQTSVLIASTKTQSDITLGSAITSRSEEQLAIEAQNGAQYIYDRKARLRSFVTLVKNGAVAEKVLNVVGPNMKPVDRSAARLLKMVSASLVNDTDTIRITITYGDPVLAAEIANAWGKAYVDHINTIYGSSSAASSYEIIKEQVKDAKNAYDKAQSAVVDFTARNNTGQNTREIEEITVLITSLRSVQSSVKNQQVQDQLLQLERTYIDRRQALLLLNNAISMRDAVKSGGEAAASSNALALILLKAQTYAAFEGMNNLQVQNIPEALGSSISEVSAAEMVSDLDAVINTLEVRLDELGNSIGVLSEQIENGENFVYLDESLPQTYLNERIEGLEQQIRDLNAQINQHTNAQQELERFRDLAWQSYSALVTKEAELKIALLNIGVEVVLASPAAVPDENVIKSGFNSFLASGIGLAFGIVVSYLFEFWLNYKGKTPTPIRLAGLVSSVVPTKQKHARSGA